MIHGVAARIHSVTLPKYNEDSLPLAIQAAIKLPPQTSVRTSTSQYPEHNKILSLIQSDMTLYAENAFETILKQFRLTSSRDYSMISSNSTQSEPSFQALRLQQARMYSLFQIENALTYHLFSLDGFQSVFAGVPPLHKPNLSNDIQSGSSRSTTSNKTEICLSRLEEALQYDDTSIFSRIGRAQMNLNRNELEQANLDVKEALQAVSKGMKMNTESTDISATPLDRFLKEELPVNRFPKETIQQLRRLSGEINAQIEKKSSVGRMKRQLPEQIITATSRHTTQARDTPQAPLLLLSSPSGQPPDLPPAISSLTMGANAKEKKRSKESKHRDHKHRESSQHHHRTHTARRHHHHHKGHHHRSQTPRRTHTSSKRPNKHHHHHSSESSSTPSFSSGPLPPSPKAASLSSTCSFPDSSRPTPETSNSSTPRRSWKPGQPKDRSPSSSN